MERSLDRPRTAVLGCSTMSGYGPSTYGDHWAGIYDSFACVPSDTADSVRFLASLAGLGPVLELAIGSMGTLRESPGRRRSGPSAVRAYRLTGDGHARAA
jgi:hypothetical protein